jgi:hypothetical protein
MNEGSQMNNAIPFKKLNVPETDFLYMFAQDCAEHKYRGNCDNKCKNCASNVSNYGLDPLYAVAMQHAAELEVNHRLQLQHTQRLRELKLKKYNREADKSFARSALLSLFFIFVFPIMAFFAFKGCSNAFDNSAFTGVERTVSAPQQNHSSLPRPQVVKGSYFALSDDELQNLAAYTVNAKSRIYEVDMNADGLINCIDYTIQFWQYFYNQDILRIVWNNNPNNGFNHLLIYLYDEPVEPQSWLKGAGNADMYMFWGDRYDPEYDRDVTDMFDQIKYSKMKWSEYGR